jgi:hypothetical protein
MTVSILSPCWRTIDLSNHSLEILLKSSLLSHGRLKCCALRWKLSSDLAPRRSESRSLGDSVIDEHRVSSLSVSSPSGVVAGNENGESLLIARVLFCLVD